MSEQWTNESLLMEAAQALDMIHVKLDVLPLVSVTTCGSSNMEIVDLQSLAGFKVILWFLVQFTTHLSAKFQIKTDFSLILFL